MLAKTKYIKSNKLRQSARGRTCTLRFDGCVNDTATVVLCHANGGGVSMKQSDIHAVFGCNHCHGIMDGEDRREDYVLANVLRAMIETQNIWVTEDYISE